MKKIITLLLSLLMVITLGTINVLGEESWTQIEDLGVTYKVKNEIVIPSGTKYGTSFISTIQKSGSVYGFFSYVEPSIYNILHTAAKTENKPYVTYKIGDGDATTLSLNALDDDENSIAAEVVVNKVHIVFIVMPLEVGLYSAIYNESGVDLLSLTNPIYIEGVVEIISNIAFIYYDGSTFTNVSSEVSINGNDVISSTPKGSYFEISPLKLGTGKVSYTKDSDTYEATINVIYPDFFAVEVGKEYTNINNIEFGGLFIPFGKDKGYKFYYSENGNTPIDVSSDVVFLNPTVASYNRETNIVHGIKAEQCNVEYQNKTFNDGSHPFISLFVVVEHLSSSYEFSYNEKTYRVGFGNDSSGTTLHIDDGGQINILNSEDKIPASLAVGELDENHNIKNCASQEIYDLVHVNSVEIVGDDFAGISYTTQSHSNFCGFITTTDYLISANRTTTTNSAYLKASISIDDEQDVHDIYFSINCIKIKKIELDILENPIEKLNNILASKSSLVQYLINNGKIESEEDITDSTEITFNIKANEGTSTSYTGIINADCYAGYRALYINGEIDSNRDNLVTINGGIHSKSGISGVFNLDFKKTVNKTMSFNDSQKYIGIFVEDNTISSDSRMYGHADMYRIENCNFYSDDPSKQGYDYGIVSQGASLASGIRNCLFMNCGVGAYINSSYNSSYSDSMDDTFINCRTGVEIVKLSNNCTPYQFVFNRMEFYNSLDEFCDYKVRCPGDFFYTGNFYGINSEQGQDNENVRSAKIIYTLPSKTKVYTNPCIKYPNDENSMGIDTTNGLYTAIIYSAMGNRVNSKDFYQSEVNIGLNVCEEGTGKELASVKITGGVD